MSGHVIAHQGGWDEILFILGPIAVVVLLLALAKRRVDRLAASAGEAGDEASADGLPPGSLPGPPPGSVSVADDARSPRPPS